MEKHNCNFNRKMKNILRNHHSRREVVNFVSISRLGLALETKEKIWKKFGKCRGKMEMRWCSAFELVKQSRTAETSVRQRAVPVFNGRWIGFVIVGHLYKRKKGQIV